MDIVTVPSQQSGLDKRADYKHEVIKRALELTVPDFGPYQFVVSETAMVRARALVSIQRGDPINVYISLANDDWNKAALPVKIPVRLGILSYRLLLVHKDELAKFAQVNTLEDLKKLKVGLQNDWAITETFKHMQFDVVESSNFDGAFLMLQYRRFDYIPRGIHEIYDELAARSEKISDVVIEPRLALRLKVASYVYVSPKYPRIAQRIEAGMREMVRNGELSALLHQYYAEEINKSDLNNRTIIEIENPHFVDKDLLDDSSLWFSPLKPKP